MQPLNWTALKANCAGDEHLVSEVLVTFRREQEPLLRAVREAVASGHAKAIKHAAHRLKGALLTIAAHPSIDAAHAFEVGGAAVARERFATLESELLKLTAAIA